MRIFRRSRSRSDSRVKAEQESAPRKRILVIGSEGHGRDVVAYAWDRFPEDFNVADYDVVILNFASFDRNPELAAGFPPERLPDRDSLGRLFFAEGAELIAIGNPSTEIGPKPEGPGYILGRRTVNDWLPFWFAVEKKSGAAFELKDAGWEFYFSRLTRYQWFMSGETGSSYRDPTQYFRAIGVHGADGMVPEFKAIAETRFGQPLAMTFRMFATRYKTRPGLNLDYREPEVEPIRLSSPIHWLPSLDNLDAAEVVDLILAERFGLSAAQRRPEWVEDFELPFEGEIAAEIAGLLSEREALEGRIASARRRAAAAAAPRALLYEKGKDALEPQVRAALAELGATVREAEREGIEDAVLSRAEGEAVLEIKGRKGPIKIEDVRQVVQWAADAKGRDGVDYKPLVVGNAHCETPPGERGEALAPNAKTYAENSGVAFLSTLQVYEALRRRQAGSFDTGFFWRSVFEATGAVELP